MSYAIYLIISSILLFFLVFPFWKVLLVPFFKVKVPPTSNTVFDYANIITAYRNVEIAKPLVQSLLRQTHTKHHIYLVADNCDISNWDIQHEQLTLLHPQPALNLKVKSIIHAIEHAKRTHDYIVIFDADNVAHPHFLEEINRYANAGYSAIQGQRTAKNLDTKIAAADALGEFYKNYVERYVPYRIGSSSVISGSGMAVKMPWYKAYLDSPEIQKGKTLGKKMLQEDKILQNFINSGKI
ncbi:MAG: glycosyltransferase family 2 protein [Saprospiraceae bacterium]|nr:glycosyltransferase family 2 protein [Saprospiraceae bacterium]